MTTPSDALAEAARKALNDIDGSLTLGEAAIRQAVGNTNFSIMVRRLIDLRAALSRYDAERGAVSDTDTVRVTDG